MLTAAQQPMLSWGLSEQIEPATVVQPYEREANTKLLFFPAIQ